MSATHKTSKSQFGSVQCREDGKSSSLRAASELRQLCQTMDEPYAHLIAKLEAKDVVERSVRLRQR